RLDRAAGGRLLPLHARGEAARLPGAECGRELERDDQRAAAGERARDRAARCAGRRRPAAGRRLLRHAQRKAFRLRGRGRKLDGNRRRTAADRGGEDGGPLMALTFRISGPLRELAGDRGEVEVDGAASSLGEALTLLW